MMSFSSLKNKIKFILPFFYLNTILYGVSNKDFPISAQIQNDRFRFFVPVDQAMHEGLFAINSYGWFIISKRQPILKEFYIKGNLIKIEDKNYFPHPNLDFAIFKIDYGYDHLRHQFEKLRFLATQEDLQGTHKWVTSLASCFENHSFTTTCNCKHPKPFAVLSKIEYQQNGKLFLNKGNNINQFYQEALPQRKNNLIARINHLSQDAQYKQDCLQKIQNQFNQINLEINEIKGYLKSLTNFKQSHVKSSVFLTQNINKNINNTQQQLSLKNQELEKFQNPHAYYAKYLGELNKIKFSLSQINFNSNQASNSKLGYFASHTKCSFKAAYLGVADKEDNGALILVPSVEFNLLANKILKCLKIVGLTNIKDGDNYSSRGERSVAIDLTTPEVHHWISETIDNYHGDIPQWMLDIINTPTTDMPIETLDRNSSSSSDLSQERLQINVTSYNLPLLDLDITDTTATDMPIETLELSQSSNSDLSPERLQINDASYNLPLLDLDIESHTSQEILETNKTPGSLYEWLLEIISQENSPTNNTSYDKGKRPAENTESSHPKRTRS